MTVAEAVVVGSDLPRLGADIDPKLAVQIRLDARALDIELMPWQEYALAVAEATNSDGSYLFTEVAIIVARQNGKSTMLAPLIRRRLRQGRRIVHSAQDRIIPRRIFGRVAESFPKHQAKVRLANGQEEVAMDDGGFYKIVAPKRGVRGNDADDLIIDELREQESWDFFEAAKPVTTASEQPQRLYLSNAGSIKSIVLNDVRYRAGKDPNLAYLEWSADPELDPGDRQGWAQANPALGRTISMRTLESEYETALLSGNLAGWETEHLCRWVQTMQPRLVADVLWAQARRATEPPLRPSMGVSVHPNGSRASAVLSWPQSDGSIAVRVEADVTGDPINLNRFAEALTDRAKAAGVQSVGFDSWTDQGLARHFLSSDSITGPEFANASERFVRLIENGALHWEHADSISEQLPYVSRKQTTGTAWVAEPVDRQRPVTSVLAAIRAVWLASNPQVLTPAVY